MRIEKLDQNTKTDLLEKLLKRSPNSYGKYEESVREILDAVKEKRDQALFAAKSYERSGKMKIQTDPETVRPGKFRVVEGLRDIERNFELEENQISFFDFM